jgi:cell division septation protein DedD
LPLIAGAGTLLVKEGKAVDAYNLAAVPPERMTTMPGGGKDFWLVIPWVPPQRAPKALAAAETAVVEQDKALLSDSIAAAPTDVQEFWLQVSSSQNPDWAEDLAEQLRQAGHPATVWRPDTPEESYRVVVGPYPTREQGDEAGRRLGRPYFTVQRKAREP